MPSNTVVVICSRISWNPSCLPEWPSLTFFAHTSLFLILTTYTLYCLCLFLSLIEMLQVIGFLTRLHSPWEQGMYALSTLHFQGSSPELSKHFWVCTRGQWPGARFLLCVPYMKHCVGPPCGHRWVTKKDRSRNFVERAIWSKKYILESFLMIWKT